MKYLFLIVLFLSNHAVSKECSFNWELFSHGILLGYSNDLIITDESSTIIKSIAKPAPIANFFGASQIKREIVLDNNLLMTYKKEETFGKKAKLTEWKKDSGFNKYENNILFETYEYPRNFIIDSTVFPYWAYLSKSIKNNDKVLILTKSNLVEVEAILKDKSFSVAHDGYFLKVSLAENLFPKEVFLDDSKNSYSIKLINQKCN